MRGGGCGTGSVISSALQPGRMWNGWCPAPPSSWSPWGGLSGDFDLLLINGTPVGMTPHPGVGARGPGGALPDGGGVRCHLHPARTRLLQLAEAEGARTLGHAHAGVAGSTGPYLLVREPPFGKRISRLSPGGGGRSWPAVLAGRGRHADGTGTQTSFSVRLHGLRQDHGGKAVAARTGRRFVDMDEFITQQAGMSVSEIFARLGEADFRRRNGRPAGSWPGSGTASLPPAVAH